jgi:hypothetical protein
MTRKNKLLFLLTVLLCTLLLTGIATASPNTPVIDWYVIGGGGGHTESTDGSITIDGTISQPVAGIASADLCSGFWCMATNWLSGLQIYLPLILN